MITKHKGQYKIVKFYWRLISAKKKKKKSTYDQSIRQYWRLTKSKKHRPERSVKVSDALPNEPHATEDVAANQDKYPSEAVTRVVL